MGQIHNAISRGDLSSALTRALGVSRGPAGLERFGETLQPTLNLWELPEWAYLRGELLFSTTLTAAAVPAEFSLAALSLPVASVNLLVVEGVTVRAGAVGSASLQQFTRAVAAATLTLGTSPLSRDQRWAIATLAVKAAPIEVWSGSDPSAVPGIFQEEAGVNTTSFSPFLSVPYILRPGGAIAVVGETVNVQVQVNFWGRVRAAYPGELV